MNTKEYISNKQGISMVVLYLIGEASIFIQGINAKNDLWLSFILAVVFTLPLILMFARVHLLFPEHNLYDIIEICFGKFLGKILVIIFIIYSFLAVTGAVENLGFFVRTNVFPETPILAIIIPFLFLCAYIIKMGIEVLGRWAELFIIIPILLWILVIIFLQPQMEFQNITPILYEGFKPIAEGAFMTIVFPFAGIVGFTMVFKYSKEINSAYKIYFKGFLLGTAFLFVIYMTVVLALGIYHSATLYFPTYVVVSMINIGDFLQRLDIIAAIIYLIGIVIQISIFLMATCIGFAKLFAFRDYRFIIWPITLLAINVISYEQESIMYFFEYAVDTWSYFILPFEIFLPLLIWIAAEIRIRKIKSKGIAL